MRGWTVRICGVALCLFTLVEVNYPQLRPQSQLALFALLGLVICFLTCPLHPSFKGRLSDGLDWTAALMTVLCFAYVVVQSEPAFSNWWWQGRSLGDRAGLEGGWDIAVGAAGLLIVMEAARRTVGWALPVLSGLFVFYAIWGPSMPVWLFPHRGYGMQRIVSQTFLQSQGVLGTALKVMFTYVFLFVLFGVFLEAVGATGFVISLARRVFRRSPGGAAKVAVLSSGLMGSLSGSAVANTATTGIFTIPLMRSSGFRARVAAGVEAAASSGGALAPPIMGAGAYMMLEIIDPPVTYLQIIRAALLPALLYYLSLLLIVHLYAKRIGSTDLTQVEDKSREVLPDRGALAGVIFFASLLSLIAFLLAGFTPFRAVTLSMGVVVGLSLCGRGTRLSLSRTLEVLVQAARNGMALVAAASCVGIVIGVVTLTGIGTRLPGTILPLAEQNLFLALILIMVSSLVLGMGLPSAVCYLLMATLIGPVLGQLGVVPLAAHFFIFYFGMMSMVTPPVALAAYTAASIARSSVMATGLTAFRFALAGFSLPYVFVVRPQLLMLSPDGGEASWAGIGWAFLWALLGIVPLTAGIAGYLFGPLSMSLRALLLVAAVLTLTPHSIADWAGLGVLAVAVAWAWTTRTPSGSASQTA